ncbi:MAG: 2-C-methyl-D-erythritol 4-phosphate cytidylyltransferase [Treponema sp.]|jgi:2-C-methyl-D-erythritol 4-phosphate cytidylyltransferase|nr:2-C-methyl-D-erythritol 4-phosphate cytidylyltransferase [Treponema sp.]
MNNEQLTAGGERIAAVILAAGASKRFLQRSSPRTGGIKKEYQKPASSKDDLTVLGMSVNAFASVPSVSCIVIAHPENDEDAARAALNTVKFPALKPEIFFVNGGPSRRASVFNALSLLASYPPRYVLIHDGARPWVTPSLIGNIAEAVKIHGAVIPLLPLTETPKELSAENDGKGPVIISRHLKRASTGLAQTPQAFTFQEILRAHEKAAASVPEDGEFTDDAEIWDRFCGQVAAISGDPVNRKITFPEDLN